MNLIVLGVFVLSLALIFFRNFFWNISPWKVMASASFILVLTDTISIYEAFSFVDWSVIGFLYFMFVLSKGFEESGFLNNFLAETLKYFKKPFFIFLGFIFLIGFSSALLLNDTIAIVGTPLSLLLSKLNNINPTPLIVALLLAITIGSALSPIGNPQNFIISSSAQFSGQNPFIVFFKFLAIPTIFSLVILAILLWIFFPSLKNLTKTPLRTYSKSQDYLAAKVAFYSLILLSILKIFFNFHLFFIAFIPAIVYLLLTSKKHHAFAADFQTLVFFAGMFILMETVFRAGIFDLFFQSKDYLSNHFTIIFSSLIFSQFLSNVPFVTLYLKAVNFLDIKQLILLAASSTLAANLTIFGGASNIIVLQNLENKARFPLKEFMLFGLLITIINLFLILLWLNLF
ncbi:MAG: SLC13 family permease [Candidatus Micrarchaeota archaeon]|nr:SLC13 family permease [Candidatus Micrarchaeota archaeon]